MKMNLVLITSFVALTVQGCAGSKVNTPSKTVRIESSGRIPPISMPQASCVEVPAKIEGNRYEKKHDVCTIEKGAVWIME